MSRNRTVAFGVVAAVLAGYLFVRHGRGAEVASGSARLPTSVVAAGRANQVFVEPEQGLAPVYDAIRAAHREIDMTMYELVDPHAEQLLADAASRGVHVRVLLDSRLEKRNNGKAFDYLASHGVQVRWSSSRYAATHEKAFVVDGSLAVILTLNLASRYYPNTRDFGVLSTDRTDATAIRTVFEADWRDEPVAPPPGDDLVWSPGAERPLIALIEAARSSVAIESEELSDRPVMDALVRAAQRGVQVSLVMTYQRRVAANFTRLTRAGVTVAYFQGENPLYVHAKVLVIDAGKPGARALVSSQNLGPTSLLHDRELGIVLTVPTQVTGVAAVIASDVRDGHRWTG